MKFCLMRHGQADYNVIEDGLRPLTLKGREEVRRAAEGMKAERLDFDFIISSPYQRAVETAALIKAELELSCMVQTEPLLVPEGDPRVAAEFLGLLEAKNCLVTFHMPIIAYVCQLLKPDYPIRSFATAEYVLIEP